ncbi:MAG: radical SAM protein [Patescibacteria group bacterium]|nr:radical SAM protein [Patescibacteria group bacterium]
MNSFEISWYGPHPGEEPALSGNKDSGTIFFCRCNLKCVYCQNWQISQEGIACKKVTAEELLQIMLSLQNNGCHNINLVSPVVWSARLRKVIKSAKEKGLKIPIIWNTNAYETVKSLKQLGSEGIVDIYLPDFKYAFEDLAVKYSNAPGYPKIAQEAILEMQSQVGDLLIDENNIARKGLIVRHLVLPGYLENTKKCLEFIRSVSDNVNLSLMSQYNPTYKASEYPEINRLLIREEYDQVLGVIRDLEFKNGWVQEFGGVAECLNPDFKKEKPFGW